MQVERERDLPRGHRARRSVGPAHGRIGGDLVTAGQVLADWGLHLIDANLAMGNLVESSGPCKGAPGRAGRVDDNPGRAPERESIKD